MNTEDSSELSNFSLLNNMNAGDSIEVAILRGRDALPSHFLFKIEPFSLLKASIDIYKTSQFEAGGFKRRLLIYPAGESSKNRENHISIYLELMETSSLPARWEVNVIFNFLIFNQLQDKYDSLQVEQVFSPILLNWDARKFMSLHKPKDPKQSFLVDNTCIIEAEVTVLGLIKT
ncbi:ubiquitin carboxyl-terminal hydrolase 12-like [Pistacia vera]|uniref:ubiquitin carboxyl-terminal hydrolase 12-like n=1 Tax=Pistacia vera TaxID=55513 RepID=UPI00126353F4|nr:ubiquitin carboxyl-terminal hydrolase 12-like [Pistacia vera]